MPIVESKALGTLLRRLILRGSLRLVLDARQAAKKSGEDFDAVPEILETEVFVGGVLVVVVVRDGEGDEGDVVVPNKRGCVTTARTDSEMVEFYLVQGWRCDILR